MRAYHHELTRFGTPRISSWRALAVALVLGAAAQPAFAQLTCHAVQRGDTASELARRITGDGRNEYEPWFHLLDTAARSVPKSQYDRLRPGWRACVAQESVQSRPLPANEVAARNDAPQVAENSGTLVPIAPANAIRDLFPRAIPELGLADHDLSLMWLGAAIVIPLLGWWTLEGYVRRRGATSILMKHFAHRFVREFERPLVRQHPAERAVEWRLRVSPHRARLEIQLAPGKGRRYPNLSDHRKNLEYDVARVVSTLADESFVCGQLHAKSGWVVVPFTFRSPSKQRGVACISSL